MGIRDDIRKFEESLRSVSRSDARNDAFDDNNEELGLGRVFLSGPMSSVAHNNAPAFAEAHAILHELGVMYVFDPAVEWLMSPFGERSHAEYLRLCIHELTKPSNADSGTYYSTLVQLDGWEASDGAVTEFEVARACGIRCVSIRDVERMARDR